MAASALTGARVAWVAETDKGAAAVLATRYPDAPNLGDITAYDWAQLAGQVDVITAGFPCQDISNAGKREGIAGKRSGIWRNVAEAVRVLRPQLVFLENVSALRIRGQGVVLSDLAAIGYDARWVCVRASAVGAAHHRDRWFCLAHPASDVRYTDGRVDERALHDEVRQG
ncbi:DNA cytosine methyltransferase [Streptomyces auratus]